ncbi:hypothetical protein [Deinococcus navajonensis]|uniref:Uncharacterized protein n=1 Tax=Deinococcus navajonensis TaxID=309884 RepID=A0ABV8XNI2_9DEIO
MKDIDAGGMGSWTLPALSQGMGLLKAPAPYDISTKFPPLQVTVVSSAWYYLFSSLRSNLPNHASFVVPEGYGKLIEHGAEQGLSGIQHFELAAHESSIQSDQVTAFHHLISTAYWSLENTQTELLEALAVLRGKFIGTVQAGICDAGLLVKALPSSTMDPSLPHLVFPVH